MSGNPRDARTPPGASDPDLFANAPCGYVVTDDDGAIVAANTEFLRLAGRSIDEVQGRSLASLVTVGGRIFLETHLLPMLEHDGIVREIDLDILRPDGERVPVLFSANPRGPGGSRAVRGVVIEARDRHRYEEDLRLATRAAVTARQEATALAETLQQTLIPPEPPRIEHLDIAAAYRPAGLGREVGGDFYDVFQVGPSSWCVVLGDVSGKGITAATVTSLVRYTVRSLAVEHPDPADLLEHLDRALQRHPTDRYCTLVVARLDRPSHLHGRWHLRLSLAGHPPPLLLHADRSVTELGNPGTPVGLVDHPEFHTVARTLEDEVVLLYTDGVTEARGPDGFFGETELPNLLAELPRDPNAIVEALARATVEYQRGNASDDIAIVALSSAFPSTAGTAGTRPR